MMIKSARIVTRAVLVVGLLVLASGASYGQQLYPLANGDFALPLSNGSISFLGGPAPLNVIGGPINLPGNHISTPLPLMLGGAPMAGFVAVPTTGGHLTILNSIGMIVGSVNLPGDHVGQLIELAASGDIAVQTSGGNLSFVSSAGAFLGAVNLPGEHINGPPLVIGAGAAAGSLLVLNQNNQLFIIAPPAGGSPTVVGRPLNLPGAPAAAVMVGGNVVVVNQNNQVFNVILGAGGPAQVGQPLNLPGAPAGPPVNVGAGNFFIVNGNNQIIGFSIAAGPGGGPAQNGAVLNLGGAPAFQPVAVGGGNFIIVNQNNQIFNIFVGPGGPVQNGPPLNLPGAPACAPMVIPPAAPPAPPVPNAGNLFVINQNGQIQIVAPGGGAGGGPAPVGPPLNLPNSPLYAVPNGIPGVYVVCCTGGTVFIVDATGPGGATVSQSYNFAGEHTGPPTMTTAANGDHIVEIPTTSGLYEINKGPAPGPAAPGPARQLPENQLGGNLACVAPVVAANGMATPGAVLASVVDTGMMGEQTSAAGAEVAVIDADSEAILEQALIPAEPYEIDYMVPEEMPPGSTLTFVSTLSDVSSFGEIEVVGEGATPYVVLSPITVESLLEINLEGMAGDLLVLTFELENIGVLPDDYALWIADTEGWPVDLPVAELPLMPGEVGTVDVMVFIPEEAFPGQLNDITLGAQSMSHPEWTGSDWATVTVADL